MDNIDRRFMYYRRMKIYRRVLLFIIGFSIPITLILFYIYEWNRMPEMIYVQSGKEQVIDFNIPVSGVVYKESVDATTNGDEAVESISNTDAVLATMEMDFSKEIVLSGVGEDTYCADLKLFGILPYKTVRIEALETYEVIPSGQTIGIYVKMDGVYVIDTGDFQAQDGNTVNPCEDKLQSGDYIIAVNGEEVTRKKDFTEIVKASEGDELLLTIVREEEEMEVSVIPTLALDGEYKIGAWIRDSLQGVGTMTFVEADGDYAALGHAVRDADTNELVTISDGALYETSIVSISRGEKGEPGEITGLIQYEQDKRIADIEGNTLNGIYGVLTKEEWLSQTKPMEIALKQEIELGEATIISAISGTREEYTVEIIDINYNNTEKKRALTLRVTDEELLELTGGIIQGMSGSPIIQNGKIIGAVTHVLVNDPEKGYGIFIENMLEH